MQKQNRDYSFDALKGFLIILVILGHAIHLSTDIGGWSLNPLFMVIYTFHMPLFIFVSGYFSLSIFKKDIWDVFTSKFKRLLIPSFVFSTIICVIYLNSGKSTYRALHWDIYNCYKIYWYLINVFSLSIIYRIALRNNYTKMSFLLIYISMLIGYKYLPPFFLKDCQIIRMIPIFGLGIMFRKKQDMIKAKLSMFSVKSFLFISIVLCLSAVRYFYGFNIIKYPIAIRIGDGICCSLIVFYLFRYWYAKTKENAIKRWLALTGRQSLSIYLVHMVIIKILMWNSIIPDFSYISICVLTLTLYLLCFIYVNIMKRIVPNNYLYIFGV